MYHVSAGADNRYAVSSLHHPVILSRMPPLSPPLEVWLSRSTNFTTPLAIQLVLNINFLLAKVCAQLDAI